MEKSAFMPGYRPLTELPRSGYCYLFHDEETLIHSLQDRAFFPKLEIIRESLASQSLSIFQIGILDGLPCLAIRTKSKPSAPQRHNWETLRQLFDRLSDRDFAIAARGKQILQWDNDHRFCGRCGAPTRNGETEPAKICTVCNFTSFPRLCPAVIVLITRGDRILLARSPRFRPGVYSVLAGFVDAGESLEATIHREVMEEVGITVKNLRYFDSQSWPFPQSLMIGFTAEHDDGEITIDGIEIEDADWYEYHELPKIPHSRSISRQLIDHYLARFG